MSKLDILPKPASLNVMIVDDMDANRAVMCRRLEMFSYAVTSVSNGMDALDMIMRSPPDIVLLDYMMPKMNGVEVLKRLRADPRTRDLPVIMVTARAESEATVEALSAGADDYVTKPIDFKVLKARIESHVVRKSGANALRKTNVALDESITMRNEILADLEGELKQEIGKRLTLEAELSQTVKSAGELQGKSLLPNDLSQQLARIEAGYANIFDDLVAGNAPNLAHVYNLKEQMESFVSRCAGGKA